MLENVITHIQKVWSPLMVMLDTIWHYRIIAINDSNILVSNIVIAIIMGVILGSKILRRFSIIIDIFIDNRIKDDKNTSNALKQIINFGAISIYTILVLQIANIPIHSLAFIGAALTLGIGLGARNLINNLISSLIIMVAQPFKIGHVIRFKDTTGTVVEINARCTIIKTFSNTTILIPNSILLENTITNLTLLDPFVRYETVLQVHRGDSNEEKELCERYLSDWRKILTSNTVILQSPPPIIYLESIDNDLYTFVMQYFINMEFADQIPQMQNELNMHIIAKLQNTKFSISHHNIAEASIS